MEREYEIVKAYQEDDALRLSFNELAKKTFGLDFEDWYLNGYWGEEYIPYSILNKGKIVANVSVNIMDFIECGKIKHYIQLGTVMTDKPHRNKGLIRCLMQEIEKDYNENIDGIYLFASITVLEFYPKFGFLKSSEYQYVKEVNIDVEGFAEQIPMKTKKDWEILDKNILNSTCNGRFEMENNSNLIMFYVTKFMQGNVFYIKPLNTYVIAEIKDSELLLYNVFSENVVDLDAVIKGFGRGIKKVRLGYTPLNTNGLRVEKVQKPDTTLFVKGEGFADFEKEKKMFPLLSHA